MQLLVRNKVIYIFFFCRNLYLVNEHPFFFLLNTLQESANMQIKQKSVFSFEKMPNFKKEKKKEKKKKKLFQECSWMFLIRCNDKKYYFESSCTFSKSAEEFFFFFFFFFQ